MVDKDVEMIIRNFEDTLIDEDKFADTLLKVRLIVLQRLHTCLFC
ncbi:MAG: hypothetical protein ACNA7Z_07520 [Dethiobacteria bacterium]